MAKRISDEERIANYFQATSLESATVMFNVVKGILKQRSAPQNVAPKLRKVRKQKVVKPEAAHVAE